MTILGLKIFRAGWVPGSLLSQYWITLSLGGTNKRASHSTADGMQAICSLALVWLLAGLPGEASCLAETQPLVAIIGFASIQLLLSYDWLTLGEGLKVWGGK